MIDLMATQKKIKEEASSNGYRTLGFHPGNESSRLSVSTNDTLDVSMRKARGKYLYEIVKDQIEEERLEGDLDFRTDNFSSFDLCDEDRIDQQYKEAMYLCTH